MIFNIIYLKIRRNIMNMIYKLNIIYLKIRRNIMNMIYRLNIISKN